MLTGSILAAALGVCKATQCKGFERTRKEKGGSYDDEMVYGTRAVMRIIPVFLFFIMYWAVYSQVIMMTDFGYLTRFVAPSIYRPRHYDKTSEMSEINHHRKYISC